MEYLLMAGLIVVWFFVLIYLSGKSAFSRYSAVWKITLAVYVTLSLAGLIYIASEESDKGPCLKTETGMMYNAATKTMTPYTYCSERGEWVKE